MGRPLTVDDWAGRSTLIPALDWTAGRTLFFGGGGVSTTPLSTQAILVKATTHPVWLRLGDDSVTIEAGGDGALWLAAGETATLAVLSATRLAATIGEKVADSGSNARLVVLPLAEDGK